MSRYRRRWLLNSCPTMIIPNMSEHDAVLRTQYSISMVRCTRQEEPQATSRWVAGYQMICELTRHFSARMKIRNRILLTYIWSFPSVHQHSIVQPRTTCNKCSIVHMSRFQKTKGYIISNNVFRSSKRLRPRVSTTQPFNGCQMPKILIACNVFWLRGLESYGDFFGSASDFFFCAWKLFWLCITREIPRKWVFQARIQNFQI